MKEVYVVKMAKFRHPSLTNRKIMKQRNWLIRRLEHGWVKESVERIKVYESIPKDIGTAKVLAVIDRETKEAKNALIDRELDMLEFC